jgi:hypothetical protein
MHSIQNTLPAVSSASLSKGMWYVFHDGNNVIRAWGSGWAGLERVYFNDELVTRHNQLTRLESICFKKGQHKYLIQCTSNSMQKWQASCVFWRDDVKLCSLKCRRRKVFNIRPTTAHLSAGLCVGLLGGMLHAPAIFGILFVFLSLSLTLLTTAKTEDFIIEQEPVAL